MTRTDLVKSSSAEAEPDSIRDLPTTNVDAKVQYVDQRPFGDVPTWTLIALMCLFGLVIALAAYYLPYGQHAEMPPIRVY
jgi:hypothetical protein